MIKADVLLCQACCHQPAGVVYGLINQAREAESKLKAIERGCRRCGKIPELEVVECDSLDCERMYERIRASNAASGMGSEWNAVEWLEEVRLEESLFFFFPPFSFPTFSKDQTTHD